MNFDRFVVAKDCISLSGEGRLQGLSPRDLEINLCKRMMGNSRNSSSCCNIWV